MAEEVDNQEIEEDIGEFDIDSVEESASSEEVAENETPSGDENVVKVSKQEWENVKNISEEYAREKAYNDTISAIKSEIPDFDANKVVSKLKEIHKKDPEKASKYNNEIGFKLLWREMTDDVAKNDAVNSGSNKSGGDDFHSVIDEAMKGKNGALKKALSMAI